LVGDARVGYALMSEQQDLGAERHLLRGIAISNGSSSSRFWSTVTARRAAAVNMPQYKVAPVNCNNHLGQDTSGGDGPSEIRDDQDVRAAEVLMEITEKTQLPGFRFLRRVEFGAWQRQEKSVGETALRRIKTWGLVIC
jgi:hypothetical protein